MGFGKAFGFSLLAYIGLNFLFIIIALTISQELNDFFMGLSVNFLDLFRVLFGPVVENPVFVYSYIVLNIESGSISAGLIVLYIGFIIAPLISAIIAGKVGGNKGASFGGWFLTIIVMVLVIIIFIATGFLTGMRYIDVFIAGVINGIFYGTFVLLFTTTEFY